MGEPTVADMALEELFKRDEALRGGMGRPPKSPDEPAKKPEEVKKAETEAFKAFLYAAPDWKEKKDAVKAAEQATTEKVKKEGIAAVYAPTETPVRLKAGATRRNTTTGGDIVTSLLTIRNQVKLYHWQTGSFARHKATDDLTAALDLAIDNFVEVYMGRYGRPKVSKTIKLSNYTEAEAQRFVSKQRKFLSEVLPRKIKKSDTDLLNIRDEILGELNKVLYLFTLA